MSFPKNHRNQAYRRPSGVSRDITDVEWSYIAGFIDGEGSIQGRCARSWTYARAYITVSQKDKRVLVWMQSKLGGNLVRVTASKSKTLQWRLGINRLEAVDEVLTGILPYLKVKREQALVARALNRSPDKEESKRLMNLLSSLKYHEWST